MGLVMWQ